MSRDTPVVRRRDLLRGRAWHWTPREGSEQPALGHLTRQRRGGHARGTERRVAPDKFLEIINAGNGRSYSTEVKFPRYILNRAFDDGFALGLMSKDLKIALEAAAEMELPTPVGSALAQIWQLAMANGYSEENHTAIYAFLEDLLCGGDDEKP